MTEPEFCSNESLSRIVAEVLAAHNEITVTSVGNIVVAHTFSSDSSVLTQWDLAIKVACVACSWLTECDANESDWSMNLFTPTGLLDFPASQQFSK